MKIYTVKKFMDRNHYKEDKSFSNFKEALLYIENQLTEIFAISIDRDFDTAWFYKDRNTTVEWAEKLFNKVGLEESHFHNKNKTVSYGIKVVEVL